MNSEVEFGCTGLVDEACSSSTLLSGAGVISTTIGAFSLRAGSASRVGTLEIAAGVDIVIGYSRNGFEASETAR